LKVIDEGNEYKRGSKILSGFLELHVYRTLLQAILSFNSVIIATESEGFG
jgi:hypothetical protein